MIVYKREYQLQYMHCNHTLIIISIMGVGIENLIH